MSFYDDITDSALATSVAVLVVLCTIIGVITSCYQYYRRQHRREREDSTVSLTSDF
jgi:hypothetical protein